MQEQFLQNVALWEGRQMADLTKRLLPSSPSPFMALFNARTKLHIADICAANDAWSTKFDSCIH